MSLSVLQAGAGRQVVKAEVLLRPQRQPRCRECQVPLVRSNPGWGRARSAGGESGLELDGYTFPDWE